MAFKFPFTNYHELNLTWILDQLKSLFEKSEENVTVIENYDGRLTAVETELPSVADTAQDAAQTAAAAASLAQTAKATADTAQENAIQAQSAAGTARQEAHDAQTAAASAIQAAQQAQATAQNFDGRITQAENDASEALEASHSFENRVQAAINTANNAASTATNAQGIATNANQNAAAALDKVGNLNDLKTSAKNNLVTALNEVSDKSVKDVQIDGQSIVASGIASIPLASSSRFGVIRPLQNGGVTIDPQGRISTARASLASIKTAIANYPVIVPSNQHSAVFYGLAKAAGDSTQAASSNEVGTYTEQAKAAILAMLGITDQLNAKQNAPTAAGAAGQVLGLDSSLNPVWINQSGGGGDVFNCAPIIINTASGDIASFADGADNRQIRKIVATIEPVQAGSGDPSPDNVRPISGWTGAEIEQTGKNLVDPITLINGKYIQSTSSSESKPLGSEQIYSDFICTDYIKVKPSTQYTTCVPRFTAASAAGLVFYASQSVESAISGANTIAQASSVYTFTTPENCYYLRFSYSKSGTKDTRFPQPMLTEGTNIDYEPYTGNQISVEFPETIYGGEDEVISGKLKSTMGMVDLGTLTWYKNTNTNVFSAPITGKLAGNFNLICSVYPVSTGATIASMPNKSIKGHATTGDIYIKDDSYNAEWTSGDVASFKAAMSGVQLVYELATPVEYTLTPNELSTLYGQNNVWTDVGAIQSCEYPADTKLYIDNKFTELQALILEH